METIRKYISEPEKHRGTSIRFDTFKVGPYEYDLRVYVGLASRDRVRAALIPYKLDKEGRYIKVDKDTIELDDFRLDMTDEEVRSLVRNKLSLKESMEDAMKATIDLMKHHSIVKSIPNYILNAKSQLEKENEYYLQKEPDIRFAYENFLTDLEEIYNKAVEFQNLVIGKQGDSNEENS